MHPGARRTSRPNPATSGRRSRRLIPERFERLEDRMCLTSFSLTQLPLLPGDTGGGARGLNNAASIQVVGDSAPMGGPGHAVLWHKDAAGSFVAQSLGTLGGPNSYANAVNDSGQVVGRSDTSQFDANGNPIHHAFSWQQKEGMTDLDTLGSPGSEAMAVSATGRVVGTFFNGGAFVWERLPGEIDGVMYDLNRLLPSGSGWRLISANGVNATQIAGAGYFTDGQVHAFQITDHDGVFGNGVDAIADLGPARLAGGSRGPFVSGMSPDGSRVVGTIERGILVPAAHATLWQGGQAIDLGSLGNASNGTDLSYGSHVNDSGQVVGRTDTKSSGDVPFLWRNGTMHDLNNLVALRKGYVLDANDCDINDASQIAGAERSATDFVPVLLTPTTGQPKAITTSAASLTDTKTSSLATGPVDPLVLDDLAHWLTAGARAKRTQAVMPGA
jgi:probable HAF family extracellular repeat protein